MRFGWLTLAPSPSPAEDAVRIDQQIGRVCFAEHGSFSRSPARAHDRVGELRDAGVQHLLGVMPAFRTWTTRIPGTSCVGQRERTT
jgi:hypothetical protein